MADVFLSTSDWEGVPLTLLEAMAAGNATIATAVGGAPDIIEQGANGLMIPVGDVRALAGSLEILVRDKEYRRSLGAEAVRSIRARFSIERTVEAYAELYGQSIRARPPIDPA